MIILITNCIHISYLRYVSKSYKIYQQIYKRKGIKINDY